MQSETREFYFDTNNDLEKISQFIKSDIGFENFKKARKRVVQNFDISIRTEKIKKRIL